MAEPAADLFPDPPPALGDADVAATPDAEPKRRRGRPPGAKSKPAADRAPKRAAGGQFRSGRPPKLEKQLGEFIGLIGVTVYVRDQECGGAILAGADNLAKALDHLAQENASVHRVLSGLMTVSAWGEVVTATMAIAMPIAAHHGLLPEGAASLASAMAGGTADPQPAAGDAAAA